MGTTLYEKIWEAHEVVPEARGQQALLYVDLHLVHEVTSPQAFDGPAPGRTAVRRPDRTLATVDHNVPTIGRRRPASWTRLSRAQVEALERNCRSSASRCSRCDSRDRASSTSSVPSSASPSPA